MARTPATTETTEPAAGPLTHVISHRHQLQDGQQFVAGQVVAIAPEHADAWAKVIEAQPSAFSAWDPDAAPKVAQIGTPPIDTDATVEVPRPAEGDEPTGDTAAAQPTPAGEAGTAE